MSLFLAPTSGNAVGRGYSSDPPPPGIDVDNVNRIPLRLLKKTMGKRPIKRLKIVPPGRQRGELAPPYTWNAIEREDWKYELPKPKHIAEGEFKSSAPTHPSFTSDHPVSGTSTNPDPRHARVDAIHKEIAELRKKVADLNHQAQELTQAGKASLAQRPAYDPESAVRIGDHKSSVRIGEALGDYPHTPGPADSAGGMTWANSLEKSRERPLGLRNKTSRDYRQTRKADSERLQVQRQHDQERRHHAQQPTQSAQIISIHRDIAQKHKRIEALTGELEKLQLQIKQSQPHHESYRLTSNNLPRLSLLLK